jgi:hypothetical protein
MAMSETTASDSEELDEGLTPEQVRARAKLRKLIEASGKNPLTIEELRAMGDVWPEDESIDDFLNARREWRREACRQEETEMAKRELEIPSSADDFYATADIETLAKQQGVGPLDFAKARQLGKFWPEDESIDEFIATVRRWRDEGGDRKLP